jgi:hypothetical protein
MGTSGGEMPEVLLKVSGDMDNLEYSYRIDKGTWSLYRRGPMLSVLSPVLAIPGKHEIYVRSRVFNQPMTTDMTGAMVNVMIDYVPPDIRFEKSSAGVAVKAYDGVSGDKVKVMWRTGDGLWNEIPNGTLLPADVKGRIDIRAIDEAGLSSSATVKLRAEETGSKEVNGGADNNSANMNASLAGSAGGWSCSVAAVDADINGFSVFAAGMFLAAMFLFFTRRR